MKGSDSSKSFSIYEKSHERPFKLQNGQPETGNKEKREIDEHIFHLQCSIFEPEGPTPLDHLQRVVSVLQPHHYDEIIIELYSQGRCGFPCCEGKIKRQGEGPSIKLSLANRILVDLTESRYYCSQGCLERSRRIRDQISNVSVYQRLSRNDEKFVQLSCRLSKLSIVERTKNTNK